MEGFKKFLLRGNLIELAVALVIGLAFNQVVTAFTAWFGDLLPDSLDNVFSTRTYSGQFFNAVIAFVITAAVVYFFVVVPYNKLRDRFFPAEADSKPADVALLEEIRDLLASRPS